jgi:hypothetical protein
LSDDRYFGWCWLAHNAAFVPTENVGRQEMPPCGGRMIRAHLIPKRLIGVDLAADPRTWVTACGGIMGCSGHHGMLDVSRTLRIPRANLPKGLEEFCETFGFTHWLDREYGPRT